jgi:hypothetical protein
MKLLELGKKVAFVSGNRAISKNNLSKKIASIKECGQLMPIVIINGEDAVKENLNLIDYETNSPVPADKVSDYKVVIEGQHRYTAIRTLQTEDEKNKTSYAPTDITVMYIQNPKSISVKKLISELNRNSIVWDGKDYVTGAALCNPTNELLKFAKELVDLKSTKKGDGLPSNGYPISTISKLATFGTNIDKAKLAKCMNNGTDTLPSANIDKAKKILEKARNAGFTDRYLSHKYFIDWVMDESNKSDIDAIYTLIEKLQPEDVTAITKINGDDYISEMRNIINK